MFLTVTKVKNKRKRKKISVYFCYTANEVVQQRLVSGLEKKKKRLCRQLSEFIRRKIEKEKKNRICDESNKK